MEIFPKNLGTRPRLAVEIKSEGVIAARADDATAILEAVAERSLPEGALAAGLKAGNIADRVRVIAALRETLDAVSGRGGERTRYVTLVVPDAAARVLLLDFDELPAKPAEALPIVRFRLKKVVPFDPDHAAVSYQVMSTDHGVMRVLVVVMQADVLEEYESAVTAAGYVPGAVLPATIAVLAALEEQEAPVLVVNAGRSGVTTAIVRGTTLLLHRALELAGDQSEVDSLVDMQIAGDHAGYDRIEAEAAMEAQVLEAAAELYVTARDVAQTVSVAAAYFEDTLSFAPEEVISAGTLGADGLRSILEENGVSGLKVRELMTPQGIAAGAATTGVPRSWMAGVRGALRN
jgi:type IV pilus assembly protein PilM